MTYTGCVAGGSRGIRRLSADVGRSLGRSLSLCSDGDDCACCSRAY